MKHTTDSVNSDDSSRPPSAIAALNATEEQMFAYLRQMARELSASTKIPYASLSVEVTLNSTGEFEQRASAYVDGSSYVRGASVREACDKQVSEFRPMVIKQLREDAKALLAKAAELEAATS